MAQFSTPEYTWSKTVVDRDTVRNVMDILDPIDTPVLNYFGLNGANKFNFANEPGIKLIWPNDKYRQLTGQVGDSMASTDTTLVLNTDTSAVLKIGDVVQAGSEKMWVSDVTNTAGSYTVVRGWGDTTATDHAASAAVTIIGTARLEGAEVDFGPLETPTTDYNYTVILEESLKMTRNAAKKVQWGIADEWQYQIDKKMPELLRALEFKFFHGERVERSATVAADTGGFGTFITTNTLSTARTALTIDHLQNIMLSCHLAGGNPDIMIAHPSTILTLTNLYQTSNYLYVERTEDTVGMVIKFVETPWGRLRLLDGRHVPEGDLWFIQSEYVGVYEYDPFFWQEISPTGDWMAREVIGEYGIVVRNPDAHAYINLT